MQNALGISCRGRRLRRKTSIFGAPVFEHRAAPFLAAPRGAKNGREKFEAGNAGNGDVSRRSLMIGRALGGALRSKINGGRAAQGLNLCPSRVNAGIPGFDCLYY